MIRFLFGIPENPRSTDLGLMILRVVAGLALAFLHGFGKIPPTEQFLGMVSAIGVPAPVLMAWLAGLAEFAGGLLIAIGLFTRPAAVVLIVHFLVVVLVAHAPDPIATREPALLFLSIGVLLLLAGPGQFSFDAVLKRNR
jgi:putative oxidoreductase